MSPELLSFYRTPFMIFGVVLGLGIGHGAKTPAIFNNVSGEQEIASLMQFKPARDPDKSFIRTIKCGSKLGRPPAMISPEIVPIAEPIDAIPCKLCVVHSDSTPVMYTIVQHDGLGSRLTSVILDLALAWKRSYSFGGIIESPRQLRNEEEEEMKQKHQLLSVLLGFDYNQLRPPVQRLHFGTCVGSEGGLMFLQQRLDQIPQGTKDIFLVAGRALVSSAQSVFTGGFLQKWRAISGLQKVPATHFKKCGINIALHVRRGDVSQHGKYSGRFVTDEVHIQVAQRVQAFLPHSCVHVFSHTFDHHDGQPTYSPSDYEKYHRVGFQVHLDNPEIEDMAHFAKADVSICTTGNFCLSVSMLNPKCVLLSKGQGHPRIRGLNRIFYDMSNGTIDLEEQNNLYHCLQTQVLKVKDKTTV